jgi:hypothetical protein
MLMRECETGFMTDKVSLKLNRWQKKCSEKARESVNKKGI